MLKNNNNILKVLQRKENTEERILLPHGLRRSRVGAVESLTDLGPALAVVFGPLLAFVVVMMRYQHLDSTKTRELIEKSSHENREWIHRLIRENRELIEKSSRENRELIEKSSRDDRELIRGNRELIEKSSRDDRELIRGNR
ncbi:MAG: hypothetical protein OXF64_05180, partial [bacterium]|nr:hypothetical protein [bacterium]